MEKVTKALGQEAVWQAAIEARNKGNMEEWGKYIAELHNGKFGDADRVIAEEVEEFVMSTKKPFTSTQVYDNLQLPTDTEIRNRMRKAASQKLIRMKQAGIIESLGYGRYRRIIAEKEVMDWWNASMEEIPIVLPFGLSNYHRVFPDNMMGTAGVSNMGKTTYTYDIIARNLNNRELWDFYEKKYQKEPLFELHDTDTGRQGTRERIQYLTNGDEDLWRTCVTTYLCKPNDRYIADLIDPTMISLIDYIQFEDAYIISTVLDTIYQKLRNHKGICFYNIQKPLHRDTGEGNQRSVHKASLYIAIDKGRMKVVKAKNRRRENIDGWYCEFDITNQTEFYITRPIGPDVIDNYGKRVNI